MQTAVQKKENNPPPHTRDALLLPPIHLCGVTTAMIFLGSQTPVASHHCSAPHMACRADDPAGASSSSRVCDAQGSNAAKTPCDHRRASSIAYLYGSLPPCVTDQLGHCSCCSPATTCLHGDPRGTQATAPIQNEGGDGGATQCATAQPAADGPSSVHARRARFGRGERRCREPAAGDTLPLPGCQRGLEDAGGAGRQLALAGGLVGA